MTNTDWTEADVVHTYSRRQALADGVLVEVPAHTAAEAGIRLPLAITAAAWADTVAWDATVEQGKASDTGQDEQGRLWDVLTMAAHGMRRHPGGDRTVFEVLRVHATGRGVRPRTTRLRLVVGPGDTTQPVLTILLPHED